MSIQPIPADDADTICGERVSMLLIQHRLRQIDLAQRLGLGQSALSKKLRGERGWSLYELKVAARELRVPTAYLLGETDDPGAGWVRREGIEPPTR